MGEANIREQAIATMPRGGPDASWLDRRFQTDALEYLDRDDVPDEVKQKIIGVLDRVGTLTNLHEKYARIALKLVSDIPNPRILELGAGHGKLSAKILELHPTATVTISFTGARCPTTAMTWRSSRWHFTTCRLRSPAKRSPRPPGWGSAF